MISQVKRKESLILCHGRVFDKICYRKNSSYKGFGLLARVYGTKNGRPAVAIRRTVKSGEDSYLMQKRIWPLLQGRFCCIHGISAR